MDGRFRGRGRTCVRATALAAASALLLPGCPSAMPEIRSVPDEARIDSAAVEVPLHLDDVGRSLVDVVVDGRGTATLSFDTGSSVVALRPATWRRLGLPSKPTHTFVRAGPTGVWTDAPGGVIENLDVGGAHLHRVAWFEADIGGPDGIFPLAACEPLTVAVDGPAKKLVLSRDSLDASGDPTIAPYVVEEGVPSVSVDVAGVALSARLDSGMNVALKVTPEIAARLPWTTDPVKTGWGVDLHGKRRTELRRLDGALRLGGASTDRPWICVDPGPPSLGATFLADCVVTFDTVNRRLRVRRTRSAAE